MRKRAKQKQMKMPICELTNKVCRTVQPIQLLPCETKLPLANK
jgi:hypothetical protein